MSDFNDIRSALRDLFTSPSDPKTVMRVPADHVMPREDDLPLKTSGVGYYRVWMSSMYLEHDQKWFTDYFPAVTSTVQFNFGDNTLEIENVVSALTIFEDSVEKTNAGNIIVRNQPLTPLVPFNGGTIRVAAALKSMVAGDILSNFVSAMEEMTKVVTWSPISTAMNFIGPVNAGINKLFSLDQDSHIVGFGETFAADENGLDPGYILCVDANEGSIDFDHLWVRDGNLMYGRWGEEDAEPFRGQDYLLLRIETLRFRDDWRHIGTIDELRHEAVALIATTPEGQDASTADGKIRAAILEAFTSPDLSEEQRALVAAGIREEYKKNKGDIGNSFEDLSNMISMAVEPTKFSKIELIHSETTSQLPTLRSLLDV